MRGSRAITVGLVLGCALGVCAGQTSPQWPQFRGPHASGLGEGQPPTTWNVEKGENILWKVPVAGLGHSSPIIAGDRIFLTTAVGPDDQSLKVGLYGEIAPVQETKEYSFRLICLDRKTGKVLWDEEAYKGVPKVKRHTKASHANATAATDGRHVVAFFGSEGLYCYDINGKQLWKKDYGLLDSGYYVMPNAQWGFGNSPVIDDERVYVQVDVQKDSFLACLDVKDGREIWRTPRNEVPTWCTPTIHKDKDRKGGLFATAIARLPVTTPTPANCSGTLKRAGDIPVPTPVVAKDLIFLTSAHGQGRPIYAVRTSATGDLEVPPDGSNRYMAWAAHAATTCRRR